MRADFSVRATDWIVGVWWNEMVPRAPQDTGPGWQWFGYVRMLCPGGWWWESAIRSSVQAQENWQVISGWSADVHLAQKHLFMHRDHLAQSRVILSEAGWLVHGGPTRMRQLAENPWPFPCAWPAWLSLRIEETLETRKEQGA